MNKRLYVTTLALLTGTALLLTRFDMGSGQAVPVTVDVTDCRDVAMTPCAEAGDGIVTMVAANGTVTERGAWCLVSTRVDNGITVHSVRINCSRFYAAEQPDVNL